MLRESLVEFASKYLELKKRPFGKSIDTDIFTKSIPEQVRKLGSISNLYKIYASYGKGNWVEIPWVAFLDTQICSSTQTGYGITFEFSSDMKYMYINLGLGWEQFEMEYGIKDGKIKLRETVNTLLKMLRSPSEDFKPGKINLKATSHLGQGYEEGCLYSKRYQVNDLPSDENIIDDLRNMMGIYRELKGLVGKDILNLNIQTSEEPEDMEFQKKVTTSSDKVNTPEEAKNLIANLTSELNNKPAEVKVRLAKTIIRNRKLAELIKQSSNWVCEICGSKPFEKRGGGLYAEAHHKLELAISRLDTPGNTICVCPLCHRIIHYGSDDALKKREEIKQ